MTEDISPQFIDWLESLCSVKIHSSTLIQPLWNGYGVCFRATTTQGHQWVIKAIHCEEQKAHPKGWQTHHSHERKCNSFAVEQYFYQTLQPRTPLTSPCPKLINGDENDGGRILVLEDLSKIGFSKTALTLNLDEATCVIEWLAAFHAHFLGYKDHHVWKEGTYWHLATRQDEWQAMPSGALKDAAHTIAEKLASSPYQTLIHGDAKVANFCFSPDMKRCAAVDFQYTGHGVGVKDLAYFIGSALSENDQARYTQRCVDMYFSSLRKHLNAMLEKPKIDELILQWRNLYPLACADFHRFLAGWSPEHWKINTSLRDLSDQALNALS